MKILLTGATGYIGRRLLPVLLEAGHYVVCLVRDPQRLDLDSANYPNMEVVKADLLDRDSLKDLPTDIDAAYFLVHSMSGGSKVFESLEEHASVNFVHYINQTDAQQIIYLSGIVNDDSLSPHLRSRKQVEHTLRESIVPVTVLRAAIIIGSGSASFEIIRDLVEKLPVMVAPKWLETRCQPIAIRNVLGYLTGVLDREDLYNRTFDIGGASVLTYKEILLSYAKVRGYRRWIVTLPVLSPRLSSYWLYFVTSTTFALARHLVDSMKNEVVVQDGTIRELLPMELYTFEEAVEMAFKKIEQSEVVSSWTDALSSTNMDRRYLQYIRVPRYGCFRDEQIRYFDRPEEEVLENIWQIGGDRGWYYGNFLWKIRGVMDKFIGGVGLRRGRRSPSELFPGDALDFWRVILADKQQKRLFLYAEMKLPGEAWLEFSIEKDEEGKKFVRQTATFRPWGLIGRLYWYAVLPLHYLIFPGMLRNLVNAISTQSAEETLEKVK
ncbi:MAG: SDR family oxidoreductase [Bacteroidota bacterium]